MSSFHKGAMLFLTAAVLASASPAGAGERFGLGRIATPEEIAGWNIDVRPDGQGLPPGQGSAVEGEEIFLDRCAACHGEFGEGAGRYPVLIGGEDSLQSENPVKTVGSYWPYASTLWDYINRAMPFGEAQTLTHDEVYALTAFILSLSSVVEEDFVVSQANLAQIKMPNRDGFTRPDPRPDVPVGEPCMKDCRASTEIATKAKTLDVTPEKKSE